MIPSPLLRRAVVAALAALAITWPGMMSGRAQAEPRDGFSRTCVYRKSDSAILVMKAAKDRLGCDDAEALNRPMEWGILVQRAMNARFIINNTRHACPGSGAGAPHRTRSGGRDIPVGSYRSVSRRMGSATAIGERSACPECPWRVTAARRSGHTQCPDPE